MIPKPPSKLDRWFQRHVVSVQVFMGALALLGIASATSLFSGGNVIGGVGTLLSTIGLFCAGLSAFYVGRCADAYDREHADPMRGSGETRVTEREE